MTTKTALWDMSTTAASNTTVQSVSIAEGMSPSGVNDGMRAMISQSLGALLTVTAGGTADALTATLAPVPDALTNGMMARVRAASANATATPTFAPNGLPQHTITKNGNHALVAGDIFGAGHEIWLCYNSSNTVWELLNPAAAVASIADATNGALAFSAATGAVTANIAPGDATAKAAPTSSDLILIGDAAASNVVKKSTIAQVRTALSGSIQQVVNSSQTGASAVGTTVIPNDNTIPQNGEGDQYMSQAITPSNASSTLIIDVVCIISNSVVNSQLGAFLFQDSTAGALAGATEFKTASGGIAIITFRHKMTAGTTSATTFKVRAGGDQVGTTTFNGFGGNQKYGGSLASSITVIEVLP